MTYQEAVEYILNIPRFRSSSSSGKDRAGEMLRRLGHPEEELRIIHVAGTNGKGSVCAYMESALREAGFRTGLFTSPHLIRINERFQINRREVSDEIFLDAFVRVREIIDEMTGQGFEHPTFFDVLFVMGILIFRREKAEWVVMETGLGGRLDATNSVAHPKLCVITSVSYDHMDLLGHTLEEIAGEKAGIIKEGVPVVYDADCAEAAQVIRQTAALKNAPAIPYYGQMAQITSRTDKGIAFVLNNRYYDYISVTVPFVASYQVGNAGLAMTALRVLDPGKIITDRCIAGAIAKTRWEGRMQFVSQGIVIDGAHNEDGVRQFLDTVRMFAESGEVSMLFAAVADKDYEEMIREICEAVDFRFVVVTQIEGTRKVDCEVFAELFRRFGCKNVYARSRIDEAFALACSMRGDSTLFCAGSLYMAGELLSLTEKNEEQHA